MNIKRLLMPGWLKTAEQKLLLNKPGIWSTRIHLVLYYGGLFILLLVALCFLEPVDVRENSTTEYWIGFVSIISVIGLTVWLIYLLRFNVFKKYGSIHPLHMLLSFFLYFISTGIIVLFTYVHPAVESFRANRAFGDEEIVQDINAMNLKIGQLEYNLFQIRWDYDTITHVSNPANIYYDEAYEPAAGTVKANAHFDFLRLDSNSFYNRLEYADSTVKLNDTMYLLYSTPPYNFVSPYGADDYTQKKVIESFDIYHMVRKQPPTPEERSIIKKELSELLQKYNYPDSYKNAPQIYEDDSPFLIVDKKYKLDIISSNMSNIIEKKYRWTKAYPEYVRVFYYITLGITLLVFIFRHSTIRTFFLSILTALLLTIFTALVLAFSHAVNLSFFAWMVIYCILFFIGSLITWLNKKRKLITGIWINLFVFLVPVFPVLVFGWYYTWKRVQAAKQVIPLDYPDLDLHLFLSELGGALLLLVLLSIYINRVYRRWYSLPED